PVCPRPLDLTSFPYTTLFRSRNRRKATHQARVGMTIPGQTRVVFTVQMFRFVTPPSLRLLVPRDTLARPFHSSSPVIRRVAYARSEEHTSELQSRVDLVCRVL